MLLQSWSELFRSSEKKNKTKKHYFLAGGLAGCYHFPFELSFWKAESYWVHTQREKRPLELSGSAENAFLHAHFLAPCLMMPAGRAGWWLEAFGPPCSPSTGASCQVLWAAPCTWAWLLVVILMGQAPGDHAGTYGRATWKVGCSPSL